MLSRGEGCHLGSIPGSKFLHVGGAGPLKGFRSGEGREQPDRASGSPQRRHRASQEQNVAERTHPNDQDAGGAQGTSTFALATLPSWSAALTTTTWGPGPAGGSIAIS